MYVDNRTSVFETFIRLGESRVRVMEIKPRKTTCYVRLGKFELKWLCCHRFDSITHKVNVFFFVCCCFRAQFLSVFFSRSDRKVFNPFQLVFMKILKQNRLFIHSLKSIVLKHLWCDDLVLNLFPFVSTSFSHYFKLLKSPKWCNKFLFRFINCTAIHCLLLDERFKLARKWDGIKKNKRTNWQNEHKIVYCSQSLFFFSRLFQNQSSNINQTE